MGFRTCRTWDLDPFWLWGSGFGAPGIGSRVPVLGFRVPVGAASRSPEPGSPVSITTRGFRL